MCNSCANWRIDISGLSYPTTWIAMIFSLVVGLFSLYATTIIPLLRISRSQCFRLNNLYKLIDWVVFPMELGTRYIISTNHWRHFTNSGNYFFIILMIVFDNKNWFTTYQLSTFDLSPIYHLSLRLSNIASNSNTSFCKFIETINILTIFSKSLLSFTELSIERMSVGNRWKIWYWLRIS